MSGKKVARRTQSGIIKLIQYFLRGRENSMHVRYADELAARSQPLPHLPGGPYHKTSKIYYFARDGRREVKLPIKIPLAITGQGKIDTEIKTLSPAQPYIPDK